MHGGGMDGFNLLLKGDAGISFPGNLLSHTPIGTIYPQRWQIVRLEATESSSDTSGRIGRRDPNPPHPSCRILACLFLLLSRLTSRLLLSSSSVPVPSLSAFLSQRIDLKIVLSMQLRLKPFLRKRFRKKWEKLYIRSTNTSVLQVPIDRERDPNVHASESWISSGNNNIFN